MSVHNNSVFTFKNTNTNFGKEVAVFAGVHGNEAAGIIALKSLINTIKITSGTVHFVFANPLAIEQKKRYTERNLNRCFYAENDGQTYEDKRARELMTLLGNCDALLDIHGYNGNEEIPFIITENPGVSLAKKLGVDAIITGYSSHCVGGTDAYMTRMNKIGICLECGSNYYPEKYVSLAEEAIKLFLSHFGLIQYKRTKHTAKPTIYSVKQIAIKRTDDFNFTSEYSNFDQLKEGEVFAIDGGKKYIAGGNEYILFPRSNQLIGEEVFSILESSTTGSN